MRDRSRDFYGSPVRGICGAAGHAAAVLVEASVGQGLRAEGVEELFSELDVCLLHAFDAPGGNGRVEEAEIPEAKTLERGQLKMDPDRHACTWKGENVTLTVTEFLILQALAQRPGVVKSRNALMDAAYDDQVYVDDRTIDSHIKRLRKKFHVVDPDFDMIETLYGVGYRFGEA